MEPELPVLLAGGGAESCPPSKASGPLRLPPTVSPFQPGQCRGAFDLGMPSPRGPYCVSTGCGRLNDFPGLSCELRCRARGLWGPSRPGQPWQGDRSHGRPFNAHCMVRLPFGLFVVVVVPSGQLCRSDFPDLPCSFSSPFARRIGGDKRPVCSWEEAPFSYRCLLPVAPGSGESQLRLSFGLLPQRLRSCLNRIDSPSVFPTSVHFSMKCSRSAID